MNSHSKADTSRRRSWWRAALMGFRNRCSACGARGLFTRYLKPRDACSGCGQAFDGHRADDFPPYLALFTTGHIVVPLMLEAQSRWSPPLALQAVFWLSVTLVLALTLLQPCKGAVIGVQWANRMHGFAGPA